MENSNDCCAVIRRRSRYTHCAALQKQMLRSADKNGGKHD